MDHYRLLTIMQRLNAAKDTAVALRNAEPKQWKWHCTPVLYPEFKCPYCYNIVRSKGIWFLKGDKNERLMGVFFLRANNRFVLEHISHPHDTGGGFLCIGSHRDGVALLNSPPNLLDCPMGKCYVPRWLKLYWEHNCQEMTDYIRSTLVTRPLLCAEILAELARIPSRQGVI